jgi:peptidoglycan hydrolase-like protein with peptidoglycan-binding domain
MMGNMAMESALISTNVEDRCTMTDEAYTEAVDKGIINRYQFAHDAYGYGLCQWTYYTRKEELYDLAKLYGVSIGDENLQCNFCIAELKRDCPQLYQFLCVTENLAEAAKRICSEFERPAVNNFADRINAAQKYFNLLAGSDSGCVDSCPIEPVETPVIHGTTCKVDVRVLAKGSLGRDVFLLQAGLLDMGYDCGLPDGDFGCNTEEAVKELQRANNIEPTGVADWFVWQTILAER